MKINTSMNNYKINDIKTKIKTDINNTGENNNKADIYRKEINELLSDFVKSEFDVLDIIIGIKNINEKYFGEKSPKNIFKEIKDIKKIEKNENENKSFDDITFDFGIDFDFDFDDEIIFKDNETIKKNKNINEELEFKENTMDSNEIVNNMKEFINDYNLLIDKAKSLLNENKGYKKENIKAVSRDDVVKLVKFENNKIENERKIKSFISEIESNRFGVINLLGTKISQVGIKFSTKSENLSIEFDEKQYKKSVIENGKEIYGFLIGSNKSENTPIRKFKNIFEKYANSFENIFIDGIKSYSSNKKNLDIDEIKKQEDEIKRLMDKMQEREKSLGSKFNTIKHSLETCENQIVSLG